MKKLLLLCWVSMAFGQEPQFRIPKYPPKLSMSSRDSGPRPGSKAPDGAGGTFRRTYTKPAALRLLVRAPCSARIKDEALIQRAKSISLEDGPVVQIDWDVIGNQRVTYHVVLFLGRNISQINLAERDGIYKVRDKKSIKDNSWEVHKLNFKGQGTCVTSKDLTHLGMRVAVVNMLNSASLRHFRKPTR